MTARYDLALLMAWLLLLGVGSIMIASASVAIVPDVMAFLANDVSKQTYLNLMDQYRPCYRAEDNPPLDRPLSRKEYQQALDLAAKHGLNRLDSRHHRRPML